MEKFENAQLETVGRLAEVTLSSGCFITRPEDSSFTSKYIHRRYIGMGLTNSEGQLLTFCP